MRRLAHLSDLHFGRVEQRTADALAESVLAAKPDVIVVSGDLTQRAKHREFQAANEFLSRFDVPKVVVPGNHDVTVPLTIGSLKRSLSRYRRHVSEDVSPFYSDDEVAIAGVNTARRFVIKGGRVNLDEARQACEELRAAGEDKVRVVVTHHPLDVSDSYEAKELVGRADAAMQLFAECKVDVFLAGHLHTTCLLQSATRYRIAGYSALIVNGGTACSTRTRGEVNSWNLIDVSPELLRVQQMVLEADAHSFTPKPLQDYRRNADGWKPALAA